MGVACSACWIAFACCRLPASSHVEGDDVLPPEDPHSAHLPPRAQNIVRQGRVEKLKHHESLRGPDAGIAGDKPRVFRASQDREAPRTRSSPVLLRDRGAKRGEIDPVRSSADPTADADRNHQYCEAGEDWPNDHSRRFLLCSPSGPGQMNEVVVPTSAPQAPPQSTLRRRVTVAASVVMGAAVPLACFRPIVGVSDTFADASPCLADPAHAQRAPCSGGGSVRDLVPVGPPGAPAPALAGGGALLILAAVVSTAASQDPGASAIIAVLAISAPIILVVALLHADVSPPALALAFLVTSAGFLLRADAVFLRDWGLPTASTLTDRQAQRSAI